MGTRCQPAEIARTDGVARAVGIVEERFRTNRP
jgi:hypothetical protein